MPRISLTLTDEASAAALVTDAGFLAEWAELYRACPWATAFQSPEYAIAWYSTYRERWRPRFILGRAGERLVGLLALGVSSRGVTVAGGRQAEYQVWLSTADAADEFAPAAIGALRKLAGSAVVTFTYIPPDTPLGWLDADPDLNRNCVVERLPRPLLKFTESADQQRSAKTKKVLNRLGRLGVLEFDRVEGPELVAPILDQVAVLYDLRQGSMTGERPFTDDPLKGPFHLALARVPGLLHVTASRLGETVIAAHLGVAARDVLHAGTLAHSPVYAKHSPGRMHVKQLAERIDEERFRLFDLTPGGDPWKEKFATDHDTVTRLTVFGRSTTRSKAKALDTLSGVGKLVLGRVGVTPAAARTLVAGVRAHGAVGALKSAGRKVAASLGHTVELRVYARETENLAAAPGQTAASRDVLGDLIKIQSDHGQEGVQEFLRMALVRLERGHHPYTSVVDGRLRQCGWLAEASAASVLTEVHQRYSFPANSAVAYGFYSAPRSTSADLEPMIRQMIRDAAAAGAKQIFTFVDAADASTRALVERLGFAYRSSLFERSSRNAVKQWRSDGDVEAEPEKPKS